MTIINDNYVHNEFDAVTVSFETIDSADQSFEIDLCDASEIIMIINANDIGDDTDIVFEAGTGVCGKQIVLTARSYSTSLVFLSSGEITDGNGKAHFKLATSADLSSKEIEIGIVKKLFTRNN